MPHSVLVTLTHIHSFNGHCPGDPGKPVDPLVALTGRWVASQAHSVISNCSMHAAQIHSILHLFCVVTVAPTRQNDLPNKKLYLAQQTN